MAPESEWRGRSSARMDYNEDCFARRGKLFRSLPASRPVKPRKRQGFTTASMERPVYLALEERLDFRSSR